MLMPFVFFIFQVNKIIKTTLFGGLKDLYLAGGGFIGLDKGPLDLFLKVSYCKFDDAFSKVDN